MWRRRCTMSLDLSQRGQPKRELGERLAKAWSFLVVSYLCIWICLHQLFVVHREREINSASIVSFREEFSPLFGGDLWRKVWEEQDLLYMWLSVFEATQPPPWMLGSRCQRLPACRKRRSSCGNTFLDNLTPLSWLIEKFSSNVHFFYIHSAHQHCHQCRRP